MNMTYFLISFLSMTAMALVALIIAMRQSEMLERERKISGKAIRIIADLVEENEKLKAERNLRVATEYNEGGKKK